MVVFARAGGRVREWRKRTRAPSTAPPSATLAQALVHNEILPTAVANRADHYWLTGPRRYMTVAEVSRTFGLRETDALYGALQRIPCPTTAVTLLGRGLHVDVASLILGWLDARRLLPTTVRYASACSGIDMFAAAVARRGPMRHTHAAEWMHEKSVHRSREPNEFIAPQSSP